MKKIFSIGLLLVIIVFLVFNKQILTTANAKGIVGLIFGLIVIGILIYDTYRVITKKEYRTDLYIVLSNIVAILSLAGTTYYTIRTQNETNPQILYYTSIYIMAMQALFFISLIGRTLLKSNSYKKAQ